MSARECALQSWLSQELKTNDYTLNLFAGDASFRRYYRVLHQENSWVVMDAPPESEPISHFVEVAKLLKTNGIQVPKIETFAKDKGFILMEDLGNTLFLDSLNADSAEKNYPHALDLLLTLQSIPNNRCNLSYYNANLLLNELHLFINWFCQGYLALNLSKQETSLLTNIFKELAYDVSRQDVCFVHRDYHSRNIMLVCNNPFKLSIIDFQDAIIGPYTYDVVSLLKDCYIDWPYEQQKQWCSYYFQRSPYKKTTSFTQFMLDYHLCGLQRHLRVLGTFSRLYLRDGKNRYLASMPRILRYVDHALTVTGKYPFLQQFFINRVKLP